MGTSPLRGRFAIQGDSLTFMPGQSLRSLEQAFRVPVPKLKALIGERDERQPLALDVTVHRTEDNKDSFDAVRRELMSGAGREELLSGGPGREWQLREGSKGPYWVDARDPSNVVLKVKFFLQMEAAQSAELLDEIRIEEDDIEKHLSIPGATFDIEFVDQPGPFVHTVVVDEKVELNTESRWTPWALAPRHAHEVMHHLGLADEYDTSIHRDNPEMTRYGKLYWTVWAKLNPPPAGAEKAIMADPSQPPDRERHIDVVFGVRTKAP
jgi:hypothetical protein